jgi:hypothetical protein
MLQQYGVKVLGMLIITCVGFCSVACGATSTSIGGQSAAALSTPTPSPPVPSEGGTVALISSKSSYALTDTVDVTIHNGRTSAITPTGQYTSCTPLTLERLTGGAWQAQGECQTLNPAPIVDIPAGASVVERLRPTNSRGPTSAWAAGTYRVAFAYSQGDSASGAVATVQSSQFSIG